MTKKEQIEFLEKGLVATIQQYLMAEAERRMLLSLSISSQDKNVWALETKNKETVKALQLKISALKEILQEVKDDKLVL